MTDRQFQGFAPGALGFFDRLAANNDRDWFYAHKAEYEDSLKSPMMALLTDLSVELEARGVPLTGDPKKSIMRINRDVRFARDKSPYKTNIAAGLTRDGSRYAPGMLYLHFASEACFAGIGFYELEPAELDSFRANIASDPEGWRAVEAQQDKAAAPISREGAAKRLPRGFASDLPEDIQEAVKRKFFVAKRPIEPSEIVTPDLVDAIASFASASRGLLEFGWSALGEAPRSSGG